MIRVIITPQKSFLFEDVRYTCTKCKMQSIYERRSDGAMPNLRNAHKCIHCKTPLPNINMLIDDSLSRVIMHIIY